MNCGDIDLYLRETIRTLWLLVLSVGVVVSMPYGVSAQQRAEHIASSTQEVDRLFDAHREDPVVMARALYETNKIVMLGEGSHYEKPAYAVLNALLKQVGEDLRLKYIVLERPALEAALYEALSVTDVDENDLSEILPLPLRRTFCTSPTEAYGMPIAATMAAYNLTEFLPQIRKINARRPASKPIRVITVDGWVLDSETREARTSKKFFEVIWSGLTPPEKAIGLYHASHVGRTSGWNWFNHFSRQHPDAASQIAVIAIDWPGGRGGGNLQIAQQQAARYPGQVWGLRFAPFRGVITQEWDLTTDVARAFDGLIWWPNDIEKVRAPESYLPILCGAGVSEPVHATRDPLTRLLSEALEGPASKTTDRKNARMMVVRDSLRQLLDTTSLIRTWVSKTFDSLRQPSRPRARPRP